MKYNIAIIYNVNFSDGVPAIWRCRLTIETCKILLSHTSRML